jgi:hypothetical protein
LWDVAGLDISQISAAALARELARPLKRIDRQARGFQDFAAEGKRGIEPGKPARSLLFHALAAPGAGRGRVRKFPTWGEIEIIENYVYGVQPSSIQELRQAAGDAPLAIVVYAVEYRGAAQTVHQKHADMCYARTGMARVGNRRPKYNRAARGYTSLSAWHGEVRVVPCHYAAYIAAQLKGDAQNFGPMRFRTGGQDAMGNTVTPDSQRCFWVPLHKLFSGKECIRGRTLKLSFSTHHHNEKLRRIHLYLQQHGLASRYTSAMLQQFPFLIPENILLKEIFLGGLGSDLPASSWAGGRGEDGERNAGLLPGTSRGCPFGWRLPYPYSRGSANGPRVRLCPPATAV